MLRKLALLLAYKKAPRKTFALLHPFKAVKLGALFWIARKLFSKKRTPR